MPNNWRQPRNYGICSWCRKEKPWNRSSWCDACIKENEKNKPNIFQMIIWAMDSFRFNQWNIKIKPFLRNLFAKKPTYWFKKTPRYSDYLKLGPYIPPKDSSDA